jgi:hypothetical protein
VSPLLGWALAAALLATSGYSYGWPGLALGFSVIVFWLLLQFNRALRMMKKAGSAPVGHVDSAVMLNAKLQPGMRMMEVLRLTNSLGEKAGESPEAWRWRDGGGVAVTVEFAAGRISRWTLERPRGA